jgi:hypothetical protein
LNPKRIRMGGAEGFTVRNITVFVVHLMYLVVRVIKSRTLSGVDI